MDFGSTFLESPFFGPLIDNGKRIVAADVEGQSLRDQTGISVCRQLVVVGMSRE